MAEFLTTTGVSYRLEEIIKSATERLVIISSPTSSPILASSGLTSVSKNSLRIRIA